MPASEAGGGLKTPSSVYDKNEYSPASRKFKGFPFIDGAPRRRFASPIKKNDYFSLLVDKLNLHKQTMMLRLEIQAR